MARKIYLGVLFLVVVMSCTKEGDGSLTNSDSAYDSVYINFETQAVKAVSNDVDTMESDANGFVVYGLELGSSDWYDNLDGNSYTYDSDIQKWKWGSDEDPSWPVPFNQMNFYAYYPETATGFTLTDVAPLSIVADIVVQQSILDQTDFLASSSGDIVAKPLTGMQPLNFTHIMSKISFSVLQVEGILTVIRQLGIENVINKATYDYINSEWNSLSNSNLGSFDDYVGSAGPFAKYGVEDQVDPIRIDGHYLMLIPQVCGDEDSQTPLWDGSVTLDESGDLAPNGAYISIRYRTNSDTEDLVGYAFRETSPNDTEWTDGSYYHSVYKKEGGKYNGPLYVKAGFKLSSEQLNWEVGTEYDYTLQLNKSGGIYLSKYYYDVDGTNTKIRVDGRPEVGDFVFSTDISVGVTVDGWNFSQATIYPI